MPKRGVKGRLAPYVPVATLHSFLERIRWVTTPKKVDKKLLDEYGIPEPNKSALLSALKFLGLIEDNGTPTSLFRKLQSSGDEFRSNLEEVVRKSYADLFVRFDVLKGDREKICNYFATNYSPATAKKATILFIDLCKEVGVLAGETEGEIPEARATGMKSTKAKAAVSFPGTDSTGLLSLRELYAQKLIESDLNITIGPGMDAEALKETRQILRDRHDFITEAIEELEKERQRNAEQ
jgi:hypothetical protein